MNISGNALLRILHPATNQAVPSAPTLLGTAPPGATVRLWIDRGNAHEVTADPGGRWRLALRDPLPPGQHSVRAQLPQANNVNPCAHVTFFAR